RIFGAEPVVAEALKPSYNVAPTDEVYAVAEHEGTRQLGTFRWGLIPFWAKDRKIAARHINARAETVATKPAFRDSFASRRCIVPADGFYEWEKRDDGSKLPHFLFPSDREVFAFAGLWASWRDPETEARVVTCTILTTDPNEVAGRIHDRMPVVLPPEAWDL
ncbi:MAG: SOS response-associated peptidase, partial [Actinobacteria bacterium]|nr:SOS response-associated peptidase [Actinomycetota bacterium]NIV58394.1 SOS response-associated peptidase [Actinomycetota bacterium]NIV89934.1 SOS response-associated peptidase [Actinomycetota bacterium]